MEEFERELVEYFNRLDENKNSIMNQFRRIKRRLQYEMSGKIPCECGRSVEAKRMEVHKRATTHIRSMNEKRAKK